MNVHFPLAIKSKTSFSIASTSLMRVPNSRVTSTRRDSRFDRAAKVWRDRLPRCIWHIWTHQSRSSSMLTRAADQCISEVSARTLLFTLVRKLDRERVKFGPSDVSVGSVPELGLAVNPGIHVCSRDAFHRTFFGSVEQPTTDSSACPREKPKYVIRALFRRGAAYSPYTWVRPAVCVNA
jgi:hypothetical protein